MNTHGLTVILPPDPGVLSVPDTPVPTKRPKVAAIPELEAKRSAVTQDLKSLLVSETLITEETVREIANKHKCETGLVRLTAKRLIRREMPSVSRRAALKAAASQTDETGQPEIMRIPLELCRPLPGFEESPETAEPTDATPARPIQRPTLVQSSPAVKISEYDLFMHGHVSGDKPTIVSDEHGNSREYPSRSEADLAFCYFAAEKHNGNADAIWQDYLDSCIVRERWVKREKYFRDHTIANAVASYEKRQAEKIRMPADAAGSSPNAVIAAQSATAPEPSLLLVRGSDITPEHQEWLWKNRFPANTLTNIVGEPDKGKGVVSADLVARLTTGRDFPDGQKNPFGKPVEVLMFIAEDSLKSTVIPRLIQAGADLSKILFLDSVLLDNEKRIKRQLALDTDLPMIKKALAQNPQVRVGIVDTITSYMGAANQYHDSEMRKILLPFRDLAEEMRVTFITIAHFNKSVQASAMNRTGGSIALTAVPRAVWCCTMDPDEVGQYLFLQIKGNLGKKLKGLSYRIEDAVVDIGESQPAEVPSLVWGKDGIDKSADDVLIKSADPEERGVGKAEKFLKEFLADGRPRLSQEVFDEGLERGIAETTLKRARKRLHVQSRNIGMQWYMRLPSELNKHGSALWFCTDDRPPIFETEG